MTSPYADWKRDGLKIVMKTARFLCQHYSTWSRVILSKYSEVPAIVALLNIIGSLCEALPSAQEALDAFGPDDGLPPSDTSQIVGINPNAPVAPSPQSDA